MDDAQREAEAIHGFEVEEAMDAPHDFCCPITQVVTANVRGAGRAVICEKEGTEINHMWWFDLAPGDVWAMRNYARWECTHGLPLMQTPAMPCGPGCGCRISLNCRFGVRSALE